MKKTRLSRKNKFLVVLSNTLKEHETMIGRQIAYRLGKFKEKEIADLQGRIGECKTYIQVIVEAQLKPVVTPEGRRKLERYDEDPEYIIKYIYGSIPNYCRKKRREWNKLYKRQFISQSDDRVGDEWLSVKTTEGYSNQTWDCDSDLSTNTDDEWGVNGSYGEDYAQDWGSGSAIEEYRNEEFKPDYSDLTLTHTGVARAEDTHNKFIAKRKVQRNLLNTLMKKKGISPLKRKCLRDRLSGMSFPQMARKYDGDKPNWDRKGNKYRKRFYRIVAELGLVKKDIDNYVKEFKRLDKIAYEMR